MRTTNMKWAGLVLALVAVPLSASAQDADRARDRDRDVDVDVDVDADRGRVDVDTDGDVPEPVQVQGGELQTPPFSGPEGEVEGTPGQDADDPYPQPAPSLLSVEDGDASIRTPSIAVVDQAGVGSPTAYGHTGVVELGGAIGLTWTERLFTFAIAPSAGVFVAPNVELSAFLDLRYVTTSDDDANRTDTTILSLLIEPSYHLPIADTLFLFAGLGLGLGYDGVDAGFAVAPRLGANVLVGRSGILTPALLLTWTSHGATAQGVPTLGVNIGYTVML